MIENLPRLTPDVSRSATTLRRCHDRLAARRKKIEAHGRAPARRILVERLLVAGICVVYLIAMAGDVMRVLIR